MSSRRESIGKVTLICKVAQIFVELIFYDGFDTFLSFPISKAPQGISDGVGEVVELYWYLIYPGETETEFFNKNIAEEEVMLQNLVI